MENSKNENEKSASLVIENSLTIYDVSSIREKAIAVLARDSSLEINLKDVNECDTAGIQLLYSIKKSAQKTGKELVIHSLSRSVEDALKRAEMPVGMIISN